MTEIFDAYACALLYGKGYNRWFDKSFNFIISKNGVVCKTKIRKKIYLFIFLRLDLILNIVG
jgi:hypothetical protein